MNFGEQLKENIKDIDTIYDLIAYCYCYMSKNISNHISFLGYYIYKNDKSKSNPNFEKLELFSFQVKKFVSEGPLNLFDRDAQAPKLMDLIEDEENRLKNYRNTEENRATIPYFILKGLDLFLEDAEYVTYKKAPLNEHFREKCLVYVNEKETLMDQTSIFGDVMKGTKDKDKIWFWATIATTLFVMLLFALPTIIIAPYFHYHEHLCHVIYVVEMQHFSRKKHFS